jgi:magnesium-transporting ATPase (P-type)
MLEQPPERSQMEIEAEVAASAQASAQRDLHGCFRFIVWCMPTIFFYAFAAGVSTITRTLLRGTHEAVGITIFSVLIIGSTFGIGCFDGLFSPSAILSSPQKRRNEILFHAGRFTMWQVFLIPIITLMFVIAGMIVIDLLGILNL